MFLLLFLNSLPSKMSQAQLPTQWTQPSTTTLTLISTTLALALLEMCGQNKKIAI